MIIKDDNKLLEKCTQLRLSILKMVYEAQSGHIGGSFSATELLAVLFYEFLNYDVKNRYWDDRDYFILSKGHITPLYYSLLADLNFISKEECSHFRQLGALLQGHPNIKIPSIESSTGSLGQGFGNAAGIALGLKQDNKMNAVISLLGDGELQEGVVWETFMSISHYKLSQMLCIIDYNQYQTDGHVNNIMKIEPLQDKLKSFGLHVICIDGHNISEIRDAYKLFYNTIQTRKKPMAIIANTIKGKGVSFMENTSAWHGSPPNNEQYQLAVQEIQKDR